MSDPKGTSRRTGATKPRRGSSGSEEAETLGSFGSPIERMKPSSVQVPVELIDKIASYRMRTGRSNGEIIIDALEATYDRLDRLIQPRRAPGASSRGLFQPRASRGVRLVDGPLTTFNVRLTQTDYDVIDKLVTEFGAFSRGHLITIALTHYLTGNLDD